MAISIDIQLAQLTSGNIASAAPRLINTTQVVTYDALVTDDSNPIVPSSTIDKQILEDPLFPVVNESIFEWNITGDDGQPERKICPWLICRNKRIERDRSQKMLYRVLVEYGTGTRGQLTEDDLKLIDPPADETSYPFLVEKIWRGEEQILWEEAKTGGKSPLRLPTGTFFSEPFRRTYPLNVIRQTQFEDLQPGDLDATIEERLFTTTDRIYMGVPADPPRWKITNIDYQPVSMPIAGAPFFKAGYLMTYTIEKSLKEGGWRDRRALVDKQFISSATGKLTPNYDEVGGTTVVDALLAEDGTKLPNQDGEPLFKEWDVQPVGVWGFLRQ